MTKVAQMIFAKGKADALDSLFVGTNPPFGYLAVGFSDEATNGFEDPVVNDTLDTGTEYGHFKEIDPVKYLYQRVALTPVDDSTTEINYNESTGKVTRTYQATLEPGNIENTHINQIAIVNGAEAGDSKTIYYSAATFSSFYKDSQSSITFRISFTI